MEVRLDTNINYRCLTLLKILFQLHLHGQFCWLGKYIGVVNCFIRHLQTWQYKVCTIMLAAKYIKN